MTQFITRAYNQIQKTEYGTIVKTSKEDRLKKEFYYYSNVPKVLEIFFPRIIDFFEKEQVYNLEMEYYPYQNLGYFLLNAEIKNEIWDKIAESLYKSISRFENYKFFSFSQQQMEKFKYSMYVQKTEKEHKELVENNEFFKNLSKFNFIKINGKEYKNFHIIWEEIKTYLSYMIKSEYKPMTFIHGDLCFSNILLGIDNNKEVVIKLIDPRGSFGIDGCHGDIYYDLAKLKHSLDGGYEYIIYDSFELHTDKNKINYKFKNDNKNEVLDIFDSKVFNNFDMKKIDLIQGLIYVGMCARHYDSLDRQIIMYANGIRILNNFLWMKNENLY